jgi:hypothetical protein
MVKQATKRPAIHPASFTQIGTNVEYIVQDDILIIQVKIDEETKNNAPDSASGKTKTVGSTHGFVRINGISLSLNVSAK